jgi:hypothetical protein
MKSKYSGRSENMTHTQNTENRLVRCKSTSIHTYRTRGIGIDKGNMKNKLSTAVNKNHPLGTHNFDNLIYYC